MGPMILREVPGFFLGCVGSLPDVVVVQFGDLNRNPKRERGPNSLPRLRFALTMGFSERLFRGISG